MIISQSSHRWPAGTLCKLYGGTSGVLHPLESILTPFVGEIHKPTHLLCHFLHQPHQLSYKVLIPVDDVDFPNGDSAITDLVLTCSFTCHWVMVPGMGITRNRRVELSHIAAQGQCKSLWKPEKEATFWIAWQCSYFSASFTINTIDICSYWDMSPFQIRSYEAACVRTQSTDAIWMHLCYLTFGLVSKRLLCWPGFWIQMLCNVPDQQILPT